MKIINIKPLDKYACPLKTQLFNTFLKPKTINLIIIQYTINTCF